jgi:hypothetical protein
VITINKDNNYFKEIVAKMMIKTSFLYLIKTGTNLKTFHFSIGMSQSTQTS